LSFFQFLFIFRSSISEVQKKTNYIHDNSNKPGSQPTINSADSGTLNQIKDGLRDFRQEMNLLISKVIIIIIINY